MSLAAVAAPLATPLPRRGLIARALGFALFAGAVEAGGVALVILAAEAISPRTLSLIGLFGGTVLGGALVAFLLIDPLFRLLPRRLAGFLPRFIVMAGGLAAIAGLLPGLTFAVLWHDVWVDFDDPAHSGERWEMLLWAHAAAFYLYATAAQKYLVVAAPLTTLAGAWWFARRRD